MTGTRNFNPGKGGVTQGKGSIPTIFISQSGAIYIDNQFSSRVRPDFALPDGPLGEKCVLGGMEREITAHGCSIGEIYSLP